MDRLKTIGVVALVVVFLPLILGWLVAYLTGLFIWGLLLRLWFWHAHARHGRRVLFVYSESPNWQQYIEANILPRIAHCAVVLNWSERRLWPSQTPWEAYFFKRFTGPRDFNPVALVFGPGGRIRSVPFFRPFRDLKHGKPLALREAEEQLFALVQTAA